MLRIGDWLGQPETTAVKTIDVVLLRLVTARSRPKLVTGERRLWSTPGLRAVELSFDAHQPGTQPARELQPAQKPRRYESLHKLRVSTIGTVNSDGITKEPYGNDEQKADSLDTPGQLHETLFSLLR